MHLNELPELVIVSPFPPDRSGVADYVAQFLSQLQRNYKCILVRDDESAAAGVTACQTISSAEFLARADLHKRVIYHLGNSSHHLRALELLECVPGVVVMHDFFFCEMLQFKSMQKKSGIPASALVESHGASGLFAFLNNGGISAFPCSKFIFEQAKVVLVHSEFVSSLAKSFYGSAAFEKVIRIPFPRKVAGRCSSDEKSNARRRTGFTANDFIVSSFGLGMPSKDHETIIEAWAESELGSRSNAHLLFVGEYGNAAYRVRVERFISRCGVSGNVHLVGYADPEAYDDYLKMTDVAVQLRLASRGETSAAILDCLSHGLPTLANAHGSVREVSRQALWLLDELPSSAQLSTALDCVWGDPALRQRLSDNALLYVKERHDPEATLTACIDAIESAATDSRLKYEADCIERYAAACPNASSEEDEAFCRSIIAKRPRIGLPQILVDISALVREDLKTGIQRVVRSLLLEMLSSPPAGFIVEPVYLDDSLSYRYAHQFILSHFESTQRINDKLVAATAGDIYFGVDLHTDTTIRSAGLLVDWRRSGVRIVNVLYDLLPLQRADCFPENVHGEFGEWLRCILDCSDSILAISRTVAEDLSAMANDLGCSQTHRMPKIAWFHLGSDIEASAPSTGLTEELTKVFEQIRASTYFLMVSTLEPRKGHALVLDAFEELWDSGFEVSLVIVGRQGWMVQPLVDRLRAHPELNRRLFWLDAVSDEGLEKLYKNANALIAASEGEGFGLPIVEAARHGVPVIARNIRVFREVGADGITYFQSDGPSALAQVLGEWSEMAEVSRADPRLIRGISWKESAVQALDVILERPGARWI
jgi:glycosyltransferase involved in cell wall biosynthesis